jgi:hypothetical protein
MASGIHAFIRDAALDPLRAQAVAQAMAGELAAAGTPLAALTVNGKPVTLRTGAGARGLAEAGESADQFQSNETPVPASTSQRDA